MALSKRITAENGITLYYHRIVSINTFVNVQNSIEVASYTSRAKREEEKAALADGAEHNVYIETMLVEVEYDPAMTPQSAYEYLKTLPKFEGANDVLEDEQSESV